MTAPDFNAALEQWAHAVQNKQEPELTQDWSETWQLTSYQLQTLVGLVDTVRRDAPQAQINPYLVPLV